MLPSSTEPASDGTADCDGGSEGRHASGDLTTAGGFLWRQRVVAGTMLFRTEAFAETAARAQRATGIIGATTPEFPLNGLGISDLLVARSVAEPTATSRRWTDVAIVPAVGVLDRGDPLTVLWENYEFGARDGRAEYDVSLTLTAEKGTGARIRAEIVGALAALARTSIAPDRVSFTFARSVQHSPAFADWISVNVPEAPAGRYSLTLAVSDRTTGKSVTRSTQIIISR